MAKRYGVPYRGSKNRIAAKVVGMLPPDRFTEIASIHHTSRAHAQGSTAVIVFF